MKYTCTANIQFPQQPYRSLRLARTLTRQGVEDEDFRSMFCGEDDDRFTLSRLDSQGIRRGRSVFLPQNVERWDDERLDVKIIV